VPPRFGFAARFAAFIFYDAAGSPDSTSTVPTPS
jgi:hypothetical protein